MRRVAIAAVLFTLTGCYSLTQGEWFDAQGVAALKAGMMREQVLQTIGRPALAYRRDDGAEVWAYQWAKDTGIGLNIIIFSMLRTDPESHALTLSFDAAALKTIDYQAFLGLPEKGPLQVHRGQAIDLPTGKAKKKDGDG